MNKDSVFKDIQRKRDYKETTSITFKNNVLSFFQDKNPSELKVLECGTNHGHTTRILSFLFKEVVTMDWREEPNLRMARELNSDRDNITYIQKDLYDGEWNLDEKFDVFFIDCVHDNLNVYSDIINCANLSNEESYFIFDDYGMGHMYYDDGVKGAVKRFESEIDGFNVVKEIGLPAGEIRGSGGPLTDVEGVIAKYKNEWFDG